MDRTSVIVISICAVLLYFTWPQMPPQSVAPSVPQQEVVEAAAEQKPVSVTVERVPVAPVQEKKQFEPVVLASKGLEVVFDPAKSGIIKTIFKEYKSEDYSGDYVINSDEIPFLSIRSGFGLPIVTSDVKDSNGTITITGHLKNSALKVVRTFSFDKENPYLIKGNVSFINSGTETISPGVFLFNAGTMTCLDPDQGGFVYGGDQNQQVSWREKDSGDVDEFPLKEIKDLSPAERAESGMVDWLAVENRYFCSVLTPQVAFSGFKTEPMQLEGKNNYALAGFGKFSPPEVIAPGQSVNLAFDAYIGPKKYAYLSALGQGQEDILDLGWSFIRPLSKIVLKTLVMLSGIGYGLAVILITLIIKTLFWPITHKSTVSMRKMAEMQPIVKEIKEKYKDNPQMMQMKTMEAYRANKVNPLGGCLPMFIQIPVFFALYSTFRSAVELRHVSFLWCENLAKPDTVGHIFSLAINPLAIVMVVSMLVQQMLTPTTGDPNQKKMMMAMPIVMLVFMYNMPAALTLYWTVNQLVSIIQQYYTNRLIKKEKQA